MADEHITSPEAALVAVADPGVSTLCIKPPRTGVADSLAIRAIADAAGASIWIGSQGVSQIGAYASAHLAAVLSTSAVPADLGTFLRQEAGATILDTPLELIDGCIPLPEGPGIGVDVDAAALDRFGVDA
jgi:L-alanine-DL-glutamate epimerase-like enolase superfamily enzyme